MSDNNTPGRIELPPTQGIDLRDLFAAFALAGIIASDGNPHAIGERWAAVAAYTMADAMLDQRREQSEKS